jgi:hypothetical protein
MKETSNIPELNEIDPPANRSLDQTTQDVLNDYSQKLLSLIQQEKEKIRRQALVESEKITSDAERKAKLAYDKAIKNAETEASTIISNCNAISTRLSDEAEQLSRIVHILKEKTDTQITEFSTRIRQQAEEIAEFISDTEKSVSDLKKKLDQDFTESTDMINALIKGIEKPEDAQHETESNAAIEEIPILQTTREEKNVKLPRKEERSNTRAPDKPFVGTLNIEVHRGSLALSRRFKEALSKVPGLEISMTDEASKDKLKIVAFVSKPLPLLNILQQMSLVKSAVGENGQIEIVLQDTDRWVG